MVWLSLHETIGLQIPHIISEADCNFVYLAFPTFQGPNMLYLFGGQHSR